MAMVIGLAAIALLIWAMSRAVPRNAPNPPQHPESLTAVLDGADEEYLAWLADHHWPGDEYLELERRWALDERPDPADAPLCPNCRARHEDVWPCPHCGRLLHPSCGYGLRLRAVERPYRTLGANSEPVIGEWLCTGCASVVGLDVDQYGAGPYADPRGECDGTEGDERLR